MSVPITGSLDRRRFLTYSGAALGAAALSGCAASVDDGSGGGAKSGSTTLTVMCQKEDLDIKAAGKALGLKIRYLQPDPAKLNALLAAKTPPDVVVGSGATDAPYFAARNLMTDLDPYFAKSTVLKPSDLDPVNDLWRYDGSKQGAGPRYGMVKDYSQDQMIWYRTDLFEAAKVDPLSDTEPLSYEELLDLGKRLTKRRLGKVKVYGLNVTGLGTFSSLLGMTASAGGSLFAEDLSSVDFSSPEALKTLKWMLEYTKADIGPSTVNPNPDGWDWPTFQAGRMAMATDGYWFGGAIAGDPKVAEVSRLAPAPQLGSSRISPCFGATGFWIPKESKNKDAAWKFFEWFFAGEPAQVRAAGGWGVPSLKSLRAKMPQDKPYQKQAFDVQEQEFAYFKPLTFTPYVQKDALDGVISKVLPGAVKSGTSAGKVADELNKQMNALIAKGKDVLG
ncbi:ABC-type glycerol-3-phosphate transport system substrate-binding protein [Streptomyces sp. SAI-144]|jgi:multiple sugar transport system substrate-binding protein|uniref:extracellular solute-binding protein n=1 Tax=Streptomyces sp. SAI-144 TaxID=2940544 RepID=UPI002475466E|nr:extracellular solute-binding protein [Streptomyces sp. SAI-144]MDH6438904.1 ABC-type glycerol-3-phosphate transport system substrate-binding protein [Streptomyces sp. SAI-144]